MRRIGRTSRIAMCSALALACGLAGTAPALSQPLTVQVREQPPESLPAVDDADYQWIDDADALLDAIGDAPPDFTFAYDGGDIWGWRTSTGHEIYAEPLSGSSIRYYYFEPGSREPFLVQDEDVAFAYRAGRLIAVYDEDGRLLSRSEGDRETDLAEQLYRRGRAIHASAQNEREWDGVDAGYWSQQIPVIVDLRLRWSSGRDRHPGWRRWHGRAGAAKWRSPLAGERQRRWAEGDRFRRWQRDGFRGPPPRFGDGGQRPTPGVRPPRPGWTPGTRPQRPDRPDGTPGWTRPQRPDGTPGTSRPPRPDGRPGWGRPRPPVTGTPPVAEQPVDTLPGVERPQRPDRPGWNRPRPPASDGTPGTRPPRFERPPTMPPRTDPRQPGASPPASPDRPDRPRWRPDGTPRPGATPPTAAPTLSEPPRTRPERPSFTRPPGFAPTERPQSSPPARVQPEQRPQFTPRPAPPPPPPPPQPRVVERPIDQPQ